MSDDPNLDFKGKKTVFFFSAFLEFPDKMALSHMARTYRRLGYNVLLASAEKFIGISYPK